MFSNYSNIKTIYCNWQRQLHVWYLHGIAQVFAREICPISNPTLVVFITYFTATHARIYYIYKPALNVDNDSVNACAHNFAAGGT